MRRIWLFFALVSCGEVREDAGRRTTITVFAASSLTDAFTEVGRQYESLHPDVEIVFQFAGSQFNRLQIEQGAKADVFASANLQHVRQLRTANLTQRVEPFATTDLVIITPHDSSIKTFGDVTEAHRVVVGQPTSPIGRYTEQSFQKLTLKGHAPWVETIRQHTVSREPNVRLVRSKVALGQADAAIVYRTDTIDQPNLTAIAFPKDSQVQATYWAATLNPSPSIKHADDFVTHLTGKSGQATLRSFGFRPNDS